MKLKIWSKRAAVSFGQDELAQAGGLQAVDKAVVRNGHGLAALEQGVAAQKRPAFGLCAFAGGGTGAVAALLCSVIVCTRVLKQGRGGKGGGHGKG